MQADADRLRHQCDAEMKTVVVRLKQAEAELARLKESQTEKACAKCDQTSACSQPDCKAVDAKAGPQKQVMVRVQLMEINRTKCQQLGIDLPKNLLDLDKNCHTECSKAPEARVNFGTVDGQSAFTGLIEALRHEDVVKVLADPTVCTLSGRPVHFHSGGEFPIPNGKLNSVEYRKFGTEIDCVPIVRENGSFHLELRARLSEIDPEKEVMVGDQRIPGLRVRKFDTGEDIEPGHMLVVSGMKQKNVVGGVGLVQPPRFLRPMCGWLTGCPCAESAFENLIGPLCSTDHRVEEEEIEFLAVIRPEICDFNLLNTPPAPVAPPSSGYQSGYSAIENKSCGVQPACCEAQARCECSAYKAAPAAANAPASNGSERKMITVQVQMVEINRTKAHELGFDLPKGFNESGTDAAAGMFWGNTGQSKTLSEKSSLDYVDLLKERRHCHRD